MQTKYQCQGLFWCLKDIQALLRALEISGIVNHTSSPDTLYFKWSVPGVYLFIYVVPYMYIQMFAMVKARPKMSVQKYIEPYRIDNQRAVAIFVIHIYIYVTSLFSFTSLLIQSVSGQISLQ